MNEEFYHTHNMYENLFHEMKRTEIKFLLVVISYRYRLDYIIYQQLVSLFSGVYARGFHREALQGFLFGVCVPSFELVQYVVPVHVSLCVLSSEQYVHSGRNVNVYGVR